MIEAVLFTATQVSTFLGSGALTHASGFFFTRDERLFLVTSRHVLIDEPTGHLPDRIEIELHTDAKRLTASLRWSIPLYRDGRSLWRQGSDSQGEIDVAVIELDRAALPANAVYCAFDSSHLQADLEAVEVGMSLVVVGFPLGFPRFVITCRWCARRSSPRRSGSFQAASPHRAHARTAARAARVLLRVGSPTAGNHQKLPWKLLGVHSARLDMGGRNLLADESLGLNCAWYADILMTLTAKDSAPR